VDNRIKPGIPERFLPAPGLRRKVCFHKMKAILFDGLSEILKLNGRIIIRIQVVDTPNLMPRLEETFRQMAADKAGPAGQKYGPGYHSLSLARAKLRVSGQ
jgi:hypothetical protein